MHREKLRFQTWDLLAIAAVLCLAGFLFALFLPKETASAPCAQIYQNGQLLQTVSLAEDREFTVTGEYTNTIAVRDGKIAVIDSDCPGGDCIHCGWVSSGGKTIVCLPNGLEIRIPSETGDVDFVVG